MLDQNKKHQYYFEQLTKIPHGSFHEQAISEYIIAFAKEHGFTYQGDHMHNVIVYKPASLGYEDHPTVLLQAHTDMVCEKNVDSTHDFTKDALKLAVEDGWLMADGTTLGADDGCGVAYMLAVLADENLAHPPLECVFTVQEEVGLFGAMNLKKTYFQAKRMINLDDESGFATCTTSAGGMNVILEKKIQRIHERKGAYHIAVKGLKGGHSGAEIHTERGNANKLLARILYALSKEYEVLLSELHGGLQDNAITREAFATIISNADDKQLKAFIEKQERELRKEYAFSDRDLFIKVDETESVSHIDKDTSKTVMQLLMVLPYGLRHRSMSIPDLTTASSNVGIVRMEENRILINCSLRGALESYIDAYADEIDIMASFLGFQTRQEARYPAWSYDEKSDMREIMKKVCNTHHHQDLGIMATHGGLECGVFKAMIPDMDIVTLGPVMKDIHTPKEALLLSSFDEIYAFLVVYLAAL